MYVNIKNSSKELQRMLDRDGAVNQLEKDIQEVKESLENIDLSNISTEKDWNENNPESKEYIKNRTHYVDTPAFVFDWFEKDGSIIPKSLGLEVGKEYECNGRYRTSNDGGIFEDVFVAEEIDGNIVLDYGPYFTIIDNPQNNQTTINGWAFSLRISADAEGFHTLDERFIPETIARKEDVAEIKEDVDKNIAEIKEDTIFGKTNKTYSENDVIFGEDNVIGTKAFYISSIDMENRQIYLSTTKVEGLPSLTEHAIDDEIYGSYKIYTLEVGDVFSIINNIHYPLCGAIVDIDSDNGIITYGEMTVELGNQYRKVTFSGDLPFTEFLEDDNIDGHTIYFHNKPEIGSVAIKGYSFSVGQYNIGAGKWSFTQGWNNTVNDDLGVAFGDRNIVGYNATAFGALGIANGERSFIEGQRTQAWGLNSHAAGQYTIAKGKNQFVIGQFNIPDETSLFIIGNGTNENSNISNAMTVDRNGNTWIAGDLTCGKDKVKILTENKVYNGTHVVLGAGHTVPTDPAHTYSAMIGYQNKINNKWNVSLGVQNESASEVTTTIGYANKSLSAGGYNVLIGIRNVANQSSTWAIGKDLITQEYEQMIVGRSNIATTNAIFVIGNGANASNRANALVIRKTSNNAEFAGDLYSKGNKMASELYVNEKVSSLVNSAPETLDTLQELSKALGDDPNFATTISTELGEIKQSIENMENGVSTWDDLENKPFYIDNKATFSIDGDKIIATFEKPLNAGEQLWYSYHVPGVGTVKASSKGIAVWSSDTSKYRVSIGNKEMTDYGMMGYSTIGTNTMEISYASANNYGLPEFESLIVVKPIDKEFLNTNKNINAGFNSIVDETSVSANNFGTSNVLSGDNSTTFGNSNKVQGKLSTVFGQNNTVIGNLSMFIGEKGNINGRSSFGVGSQININGNLGFGFGSNLSISDNQFVIGNNNVADAGAAFIVGKNGNNIFTIKNSGKVMIGEKELYPITKEDMENSEKIHSDMQAEIDTSFEQIDLLNQKYDSLVKLSKEEKTQLASFESTGFDNTNAGSSSVQFGSLNYNGQENVVQIGRQNTTEGASGGYIYQIGFNNSSKIGQSYLFGRNLIGADWEQVVIGKYNKESTALLVIGNGTSVDSRANALEIFKNNDAKFAGDVYSKDKILATQEYVDEVAGGYLPGFPVFDWNANETDGGYILNRTHYTEKDKVIVDAVLTRGELHEMVSIVPMPKAEWENVNVYIDGKKKNGSIYYNANEDFVQFFSEDGTIELQYWGRDALIVYSDGKRQSIKVTCDFVKTLDKKYMPEVYATLYYVETLKYRIEQLEYLLQGMGISVVSEEENTEE